MDNQHKVSLGCGTLILIALIVMIFGNAGSHNSEITNLQQQVIRLDQKVDKLQTQLNEQSKKLEEILGAVSKSEPKQ